MQKTKQNKTFTEKVKEVVRNIPRGSTRSYGEVAKKAGSPRAYRAVARIMSTNYDPTVPCHRVVRANGSLGGYNRGGEKAKHRLLTEEGVYTK